MSLEQCSDSLESASQQSCSPSHFEVDNALGPLERVEVDAGASRIDVDQEALYLLYAMGAVYALPERYHGVLGDSDEHTVGLAFLEHWDELSPITQSEIEAFLAQPERGEFYATRDGVTLGRQDAAFPQCGPAETRPFGGAIHTCLTSTEHFEITWYLSTSAEDGGVAETDRVDGQLVECALAIANCNHVPDYVDMVAASLEDAWDTYAPVLGYRQPHDGQSPIDVKIHALEVGGMVLPWTGSLGSGPIVEIDNAFANGTTRDDAIYLARHELFHLFQYEYLSWAQLTRATPWYWMEATAEWAAHWAEVSPLPNENDGKYAHALRDYLARPHLRFDTCECPGGHHHEYGKFIVAEHLEEEFNAAVLREGWENIHTLFTPYAHSALDNALQGRGSSLGAELRNFAIKAYTMDFADGTSAYGERCSTSPPARTKPISESRPATSWLGPDRHAFQSYPLRAESRTKARSGCMAEGSRTLNSSPGRQGACSTSRSGVSPISSGHRSPCTGSRLVHLAIRISASQLPSWSSSSAGFKVGPLTTRSPSMAHALSSQS